MYKIVNYITILFVFSNCSYYSFKGSIPAHIQNVVIPPIINQTSEYTVATILNEKFLDLMLLENILDIVSYENADSKLDIIVRSISDKPNVFSSDNNTGYEVVNEWKVMIQINMIWYDLINNKDIINKSITEWSTYSLDADIGNDLIDNDLDGLIDSEDSDEYGTPKEGAMRIAIDKVSKRIINEITSTW
tara:strand:+ start:2735 stop:3304 length:570 start_codon:yes stop_codon:yes gene_type:complete